jgi:hypothetical protein
MDEMSRANRTTADFKAIWGDGEFWSCLGYEGIPVVFCLLPEAFHSLEERDKRGLMRLLGKLAEGTDQSLRERVCDSEGLSPGDRLTRLLSLSALFAPPPKVDDGTPSGTITLDEQIS